jgi:hypothetical protein
VVENSTAIAAGLAGLLLILESRRAGNPLRRILLIAAAAGVLFHAGEEISWGQRIIGFSVPEAIRAANTQGEFNLHNLKGVQNFPKYRPPGLVILIWLAASIVLSRSQRRSDAASIIRALPLL